MAENTDIDIILKKFPDIRPDFLIPILQEVQDNIGFITEEAVKKIGVHLNIASSKIYGVASFYNQFRFSKKGRYHIKLCYGTACHVVGASTLLKELEKLLKIKDGEVTKDGLFSLELQTCIGGCGQAPVIAVNDEYYGKMDMEKLEKLFDELKSREDMLMN